MNLPANFDALPGLDLDDKGAPVFSEPWQARVFAMTLQAHQAGAFTWAEWTRALGAELAKPGTGTQDETGYYGHWLAAFEALLSDKGVAAKNVLQETQEAWDRAAKATPHGEPIELFGKTPGPKTTE
ncbi:nitrile hydratase accessory protein [Roseibium denhamense]|uniref:Nitrile hydratase accessory protein n=1 Tax=Roseibium denhamense TaxID=76305 RepID=A0ABY1PNU0_9HYPH|nr:nitrile hydratase accessory protein [Roseibium denhamense]